MKNGFLVLSLVFFSTFLFGQGSNLPLWNEAYHMLDRLEIKSGLPAPYHSSLKYYKRGDVARYALTIDTAAVSLNSKDRLDLYYIFKDNNEWLSSSYFATTLAGKKEKADIELGLTQVEASMQDARFIESRNPIFKYIYRTPANFLEVNDKYFPHPG